MPKTFAVDKVQVHRLILTKDHLGALQVYAEYDLLAAAPRTFVVGGVQNSTQVLQSVQDEVSTALSGARKSAAATLFDFIAADVAAAALA